MQTKKNQKPATGKIVTKQKKESDSFLKDSESINKKVLLPSISSSELFSYFTADIIKEKVLFTR
jgi:hypothetical protein